jgi:hypothetical protein
MQRAMNVLAYRELSRTMRPVALWWTEGSNAMGSCALVTRGLPPTQSFVAMVAGEWRGAGWSSIDPNPEQHHSHSAVAAATVPEGSGAGDTVVMRSLDAGPLEVSTFHEPLVRTSSRPEPGMRFVDRPEIGLWGVASAEDVDGGQALADILQEVPPAATLSSLAESVRESLERILNSFYRNTALARAIVFVARENECALVCAGDVQVLRHSLGSTDFMHMGTDSIAAPSPALAGGLMDLINGTAAPAPVRQNTVEVRYQTMRAGDYWLVSGGPLFEREHLAQISAALSAGADEPPAAFANMRAACDAGQWPQHSALPLIVLRASHIRVGA